MPLKLIIAIHGIGDQTHHETAQSVAFRFFDYYELPPALPLGRFYAMQPAGVAIMQPPGNPDLAFAEVYWADIPRTLVKEGYTLENAKRWARTIVARLNLRAKQAAGGGLSHRQYRMLEAVLDEMIDTVFVLDNLTFLADRAGIFKFNLKEVLDNYLNDVQVVTEFESYRHKIIGGLDALIGEIEKDQRFEAAEIYIIGHSEGSVVALLGLLEAMSRPAGVPKWASRVRGLMTIGSPIEPHLILWEDLWTFTPKVPLPQPIPWWNYFDFGDPIAYRLERTRAWLNTNGWHRHFEFPDTHDVGFSRYPLPGKAHVDYWQDAGVFNHFIDEVVKPGPPQTVAAISAAQSRAAATLPKGQSADTPPKRNRPSKLPTSRLSGLVGRPLPSIISAALLFLAVFALYKPVADAMQPSIEATVTSALTGSAEPTATPSLAASDTFKNLLGFAWILAAITVAVRVPRLTTWRRSPRLWILTAMFYAGAFVSYRILVHPISRQLLDDLYTAAGWSAGDSVALLTSLFAITVIASVWSFAKPKRGVGPLLLLGTILVGAIVIGLLMTTGRFSSSLWPVVVGGAFFLYLWWLAVLVFDLSIIWHTYIRFSEGVEAMRRMVERPAS
jgi:hypothetical protein